MLTVRLAVSEIKPVQILTDGQTDRQTDSSQYMYVHSIHYDRDMEMRVHTCCILYNQVGILWSWRYTFMYTCKLVAGPWQ